MTKSVEKEILTAFQTFCDKGILKKLNRPELKNSDSVLQDIFNSALSYGVISNEKKDTGALWQSFISNDDVLLNIKKLKIIASADAGIALHLNNLALGSLAANFIGIKDKTSFLPALEMSYVFDRKVAERIFNSIVKEKDSALRESLGEEKKRHNFTAQSSVFWHKALVFFLSRDNRFSLAAINSNDILIEQFENNHGLDNISFLKCRVSSELLEQKKINKDEKKIKELFMLLQSLYCVSLMTIALSCAEKSENKANKYASERMQGGLTIQKHSAISKDLRQIKTNLLLCENMLNHLSRDFMSIEHFLELLDIKEKFFFHLAEAAETALQIFGGYGYMKDFGVEKLLRDVNHLRLLGFSNNDLSVDKDLSKIKSLKLYRNLAEKNIFLKRKDKKIFEVNAFEHESKTLRSYRMRIKKFAVENFAPSVNSLDLKSDDLIRQKILLKAAGAGFFSDFLPFPLGTRKYALRKYSNTTLQCIKLEETASICGGIALLIGANALGVLPVFLSKNFELIRKFAVSSARKNRKGDLTLFSFAATEPSGGSDFQLTDGARLYKPITKAKKIKEGWILNGRKCFISNGSLSRFHTVFADSGSKGVETMSCFLVDSKSKGFSLGRNELKMGQRASTASELIFDDIFVPNNHLIGKENEGFNLLRLSLNYSRLPVSAIALGIARNAFENALDFTRKTSFNNKTLFSYPEIQGQLSEMAIEITAMRSMLTNFAARKKITQYMASMGKVYLSDSCVRICRKAMDILGNHGFLYHNKVEKAYRDARLTQIYEGTNQINLFSINEELF